MLQPDIKATKPSKHGHVRVTGGPETGPFVGNVAQVSIGDKVIPVTEAVITIKPGELVTMQFKTRPELIDIEVLEKNTKLIIKEFPGAKE